MWLMTDRLRNRPSNQRTGPGRRLFDSHAVYCTVNENVLKAVAAPDVPVTVTV
jgi:hypothetical protein